MDAKALYPLGEDAARLLRHCRLPLHHGIGRIASHDDTDHSIASALKRLADQSALAPSDSNFAASCLVPAASDCLIIMRWESDNHLARNFGKDLVVAGTSPDGPFELSCPQYYVNSTSTAWEKPGWSIASPRNGPLTIRYGNPRPIASVRAVINNFDFEYGNVTYKNRDVDAPQVLQVHPLGRTVNFRWREDHRALLRLVETEVLRYSALVTFSFSAWPNATEDDLSAFAHQIAAMCSFVAKQHTGIPVLSLLDTNGHPVKRIVGNAVESAFRTSYVLRDLHLPEEFDKLVDQCFAELVVLLANNEWQRLFATCRAIEDPPFLEQKAASLMAAVELLMRICLVEQSKLSLEESEKKTLPELVGLVKKHLGWSVPTHYTTGERHRLLRNAVAHGNKLPSPAPNVRNDFDKWHLFLLRRILLRLGFDGKVASPQGGFASVSDVHEFSEVHNSFAAP